MKNIRRLKKYVIKNLLLLLVGIGVFFLFNGFLTETAHAATLPNPMERMGSTPQQVVGNIIKIVLGLVGTLSLVMFIYGGLQWMLSSGNPEKVKKGRDTLIWATLGLVIIFTSYMLVNFIITALTGGQV